MDACNTINMFDSYGDGWNDGTIDVAGESFGLPAGATGTALLGTCVVVCDYSEIAVSVSGTDEGSDFGFAITDASGATVVMGGSDFDGLGCFDLDANCYSVSLSSSGGNGPVAGTLTVGDQSFDWGDSVSSWTSLYSEVIGNGCPVYGCTDEAACNYDASATDDDGSCYIWDNCEVILFVMED